MSLYNMLFGNNPIAPLILGTLSLSKDDFGRFRDIYLAEGKIAVYTRCGGGNREAYQEVFDAMEQHPCFEYDEDDSFDNTYATFYFKYPDEFADGLKAIESNVPFDPDARWKAMFDALGKGKE
jgi:hypothetical protein